MSKRGIMLRLIDVVLILLFGFIAISEVTRQSQIKLPESYEMPLSKLDKEEILIIGITKDGKFLVEDETMMIDDFDVLRQYILTKRDEFAKRKAEMRVRIRSNWDTPIMYTLWIAEFCNSIGVTKGMDVQRKSKEAAWAPGK